MRELIDILLHLDKHLTEWATSLGSSLYFLLFAVVFAETGLVVTPFLPGDSLLFAIGMLVAGGQLPLDLVTIMALLIVAAILGDTVNYMIGARLGPAVFTREDSWLLNKKHLLRTQGFYERHGTKTIFLARFVPIVRTFAPFVAGIGKMEYRRFGVWNITGGVVWVVALTLAGYTLGGIPAVKNNFERVILLIVAVSVMPIVIELLRGGGKGGGAAGGSDVPAPPAERKDAQSA